MFVRCRPQGFGFRSFSCQLLLIHAFWSLQIRLQGWVLWKCLNTKQSFLCQIGFSGKRCQARLEPPVALGQCA